MLIMNERKKPQKWSPRFDALFLAIGSMTLASMLIAGTYATVTGALSLSVLQSTTLAILIIVLIGLATWGAAQVRPWWPKTRMSRATERTRKRVEAEWSELFRLSEKVIAVMDEAVKEIPSRYDMDDPKVRVIHGLSRQTVKGVKAGLTTLQDGFPEAAICNWRTIFEIRTNAGYVWVKNQRVAERFMEWGQINHLRRTHPESPELKQLQKKWEARKLKPNDPDGWTGNPPKDITQRAEDIGLQRGQSTEGRNQIDLYRLSNAFVHANWTASSIAMGQSDVENTEGAAEGVGEVLYLIMETACETLLISASDETYRQLYGDLWKLRELVRGSPERLRGTFIRMPTTEIIGMFPDGRIAISTVKRREEWPEQAEERTKQEVRELLAMFDEQSTVGESSPGGTGIEDRNAGVQMGSSKAGLHRTITPSG